MAKEELAVTKFREYLRIKTVQPNPDYESAVRFLVAYAEELGLPCQITEVAQGKPVITMTWEGANPKLGTVLLNSHSDVSPAFAEYWTFDPFGGEKDADGNIYGRGAQDMKCVGIQYLEAIRKLRQNGVVPVRTVHVTFVPDEQVGSEEGMKLFVKHEDFRNLNIAFAMDEGLASEDGVYRVYNAERSPWWIKVTCTGNAGLGAYLVQNTAIEKLRKITDAFLEFRAEQEATLKNDSTMVLGDVTSVNCTMIEGGVQPNMVPAEMSSVFDVRVTVTQDMLELENKIHQWAKSAGDGIKVEFLQKNTFQGVTPADDSNPWWVAFQSACNEMGIPWKREVFPAFSDGRIMRQLGLPALGFSPMINTPITLHDHNEFLNERVFLTGVDVYCGIISSLASVPGEVSSP